MEKIAQTYPTTAMRAILDAARGAVALSEDRPADALARLREASDRWRELDASYETAQVGVRIGEGADHSVTRRANGVPNDLRTARRPADASRVRGLLSGQNAHLAMLSPREIEVLRLIVRGGTKAERAAQLCHSERTIHRHVNNILTKLDVRSRTSAATYAVQHGLT